ncbi:MAG: ATP-dependent helicase [Oscillospiraceae bacterium]
MSNQYNTLKNKALEKYFENMNDMQRKAIFKIKGPLLILAGAGSGKTTVLINRIANMIYFGDAYNNPTGYGKCSDDELQFLQDYAEGKTTDASKLADIVAYNCVKPWSILAITFTNKAANELKERIADMLGENGSGITAATFHSLCVRILRREADKIGFTSSFNIYDTDDSKRLIKSILQNLEISDRMFPPRMILSEISKQKEQMITPEEYYADAQGDYKSMQIAKIYSNYQQSLKAANAMDFDDILCHTVKLFQENPDVLDHYQNLYKFILVDEYQDTNIVQFKLIAMLSDKYKNLCVVGDDDQSIYKFRGATIENILSFEKTFNCNPDTDVIRLEQNYRSTQNILTCANELIKNNNSRKGKTLWTDSGDGEKVTVYKCSNEKTEANFVADTIFENVQKGEKFGSHAVLYRMNAQSNPIEQAFIRKAIPYRIFGGLKFYERKEIKDILAYLSVINNHSDWLRLSRIINEPKRGIGDATINTLEQITSDLGEDPISIMERSAELVPIAKRSKQLMSLAEMFNELSESAEQESLEDLLDLVLEKSGYGEYLKSQGEEGANRLENINELKSTMINYEENSEEPSLTGFLEEISLYTDLDSFNEDRDYVPMMTVHSAKGLEFPNVFVVGMEENLFPSAKSTESEDDIEEERRLAYVAITRAKKKLYLSYAAERMLFGRTTANRVSRFIKELPKDNIEKQEEEGASGILYKDSKGFGEVHSMNLQSQIAKKKSSQQHVEHQEFHVGDRAKHNIFGEGTILSATKMADDTLLEIAFDNKGTKKIMANFTKIKKI